MLLVFPLPYYLTHSSMDYRQPIESQIVILVTIGLFGFRDWTASADSQAVEDFRRGQPEPLMAYTFTGETLCQTRSSAVEPKMY
jgi:hypothetical protein